MGPSSRRASERLRCQVVAKTASCETSVLNIHVNQFHTNTNHVHTAYTSTFRFCETSFHFRSYPGLGQVPLTENLWGQLEQVYTDCMPVPSLIFSLLFCHAPLGVHSAIHRHQPPKRAVLSQVDSFFQCEVVGSQISLDGIQPRATRTPWWSPPVL